MVNRSILLFQRNNVFLFASIASILLSIFIYEQQSIINPDAICYLMSAREIGITGIEGAMNLCGQAKWPFYSLLIYALTKSSHFSYLASAYLLDSFFSLLTVVTFILIVRALGGRGRILWLAAGIILFAHSLNGAREYIIRDHGFWSFYLISLLLLLYYMEKPTFSKAFFFSVSISTAALFRIEGLLFLMIPVLSLFYPNHSLMEKIKGFFAFYLLVILSIAMIAIWLFYHPNLSLEKFGRLSEIPYQLHYGFMVILERYQNMQTAVANYVLTREGNREASLILALIFLSWYLISVINNLSWAYFLLLFYALKTKVLSLSKGAKFVIYSYLCMNVLITFTFLLERHFLSKRYLIALSLLLMLPLPFALNHIMHRSHVVRARSGVLVHRNFLILMFIILMLFTIRNDFMGRDSKAYIQDAGHFIAENISKGASLYINDYQLMYYSKRFDKQIFNEYYREALDKDAIASGDFKQYDFLAIRFKKKDQFSSSINKLTPIKTFSNKKGDKVIIYENPLRKNV